jgi:alginate O-acetyltransferase complex protein AlgI
MTAAAGPHFSLNGIAIALLQNSVYPSRVRGVIPEYCPMLFNSYEFILAFLPITLLVYFWLGRHGTGRMAIAWLVAASLFFYGWWNAAYLLLIVFSMLFNYGVGLGLSSHSTKIARKPMLVFGIAMNLGLLGYYKYANFFVANLNAVADTNIHLETIILPLAISFFTFQQITYLIDSYRRLTHEYRFLHYCLFVTFFPQLIAGPIVHHSEMLPQFARRSILRPHASNIAVGVTLFFIGLFKKAVLADGIAAYATPVFDAAAAGETLTLFEAWGGALAYTFQLYFDFSGYSDMALGAARMFGIILPLNFFSPYKAASIIDFWRRWHMTLSRFLRDYVYIPLGGNRHGPRRRYVNVMATMLLGGLWHGAGWTFVVWGGLHGFYLMLNHGWNALRRRSADPVERSVLTTLLGRSVTFLAVVVAWVFFRAVDLPSAMAVLEGMSGLNGVAIPSGVLFRLGGLANVLQGLGVEASIGSGSQFVAMYLWIAALLAVAFLAPNSAQITGAFQPVLDFERIQAGLGAAPSRRIVRWMPTRAWALVTAVITAAGLLALPQVTEFLYFQF